MGALKDYYHEELAMHSEWPPRKSAAFAHLNALLAASSPIRRSQSQKDAIKRARDICDIARPDAR